MRCRFSIVLGSAAVSGCMTAPSFEKMSGVTPKTVVDVIACELVETRDNICRSILDWHNKPAQDPANPCKTVAELEERERKAQNDERTARRWLRLAPRVHDKALELKAQLLLERSQRDLAAVKAHDRGRPTNLSNWKAFAELTFIVDEQMTLAPAFTHTGLVAAFDWGAKLSTEAQRTYTESVTFEIGKLTRKNGRCDEPPSQVLLNGNLGLKEVVRLAFGSIDEYDEGIVLGSGEGGAKKEPKPDAEKNNNPLGQSFPIGPLGPKVVFASPLPRRSSRAGGGGDRESSGKKEGAFGTAIEFVVTTGVGASGPTWTLANFKGPGKLFTSERQNTHKLRVSFVKSGTNESEAFKILQNLQLEDLSSSLKR